MVIYLPVQATEETPALDELTPREIVRELDKYVIGQAEAKRAVAIALRNRIRRQKLDPEMAEEVYPKNILMIGPTGVGKTEIARRLAKLANSPFLKVEASKFTEVGYVGRDVESMIRDLVDIAIDMVREEKLDEVAERAERNAEERLLDLLTVALLFSVFVLLAPEPRAADPRIFRAVRVGALGAALLSTAVLLLVFWLAADPARLGRLAGRWGARLPGRAGTVLARLVERFAEGLHVVRRPRELAVALALSLPLWMAIAAGIWLTSLAFDVTLPFSGSFLVMSLLVVGVAVPTPGAVGGFHAAYRVAATQFYGASDERAVGAGLVLHAVSFVPVTVAGMAFMAQEGLTLAGLRRAGDAV